MTEDAASFPVTRTDPPVSVQTNRPRTPQNTPFHRTIPNLPFHVSLTFQATSYRFVRTFMYVRMFLQEHISTSNACASSPQPCAAWTLFSVRTLGRRSCPHSSVDVEGRRRIRSAGAGRGSRSLYPPARVDGSRGLLSTHAWRAIAPGDKRPRATRRA